MLQSLREETEGKLRILLSPREKGLASFFKEVRPLGFSRFLAARQFISPPQGALIVCRKRGASRQEKGRTGYLASHQAGWRNNPFEGQLQLPEVLAVRRTPVTHTRVQERMSIIQGTAHLDPLSKAGLGG